MSMSHRRNSSNDLDPLSAANIYYAANRDPQRNPRTRTLSSRLDRRQAPFQHRISHDGQPRSRRASHDEGVRGRRFLIDVNQTLKELLAQEDSDRNEQITIEDVGPKVLTLGTVRSQGYRKHEIRGTYMLSNLLQELTLARNFGRDTIVLDEARLDENPVLRLERVIRTAFWDNLTRRIDASSIDVVARDPKDWTSEPRPRIYVPRGVPEQYEYYSRLAKERSDINLDVRWLPASSQITGAFIRDLNAAPGLLAIAMEQHTDSKTGQRDLRGIPFIVPGGRFNELYGWDSYMETLGLLQHDRVDLAQGMVQHFVFCIEHYGKIFNANRSYYLGRSQPPFLTDMAWQVYCRIQKQSNTLDFLRRAVQAAIKEYHGVWMAAPRFDPRTGLSRYRPEGIGVPPETEASHFVHILRPYAEKHGLTHDAFVAAYNAQSIHEPELDEYFLHDRAVRESGHDTSYRLERVAANLATIDLNALLYKYEVDIARIIHDHFDDALIMPESFCAPGFKPDYVETSSTWQARAEHRRVAADTYLWHADRSLYRDYDTVLQQPTQYESATTFWALWSGLASPEQAAALVQDALPRFEELGGLASGTHESLYPAGSKPTLDRPNRQWDWPYGWAPQQMLAWQGLINYGYADEARRLAYRWCWLVTKAFTDFGGVVVEKYDVTRPVDPHRVDAEYGNQGADFRGVATEGFGWVNASYVVGLSLLTEHMRRALGTLTPWETFHRMTSPLPEIGGEQLNADNAEG